MATKTIRRPSLRSNWIPSPNIARQIAGFEGGRSADGKFHAYFDTAGSIWTQGYGHTENVRSNSAPWSLAKAIAVLVRDLTGPRYGGQVRKRLRDLGLKVSRKQFSALLDCSYNAGPGCIGPGWKLGQALERYAKAKTARNRSLVAQAMRSTAVTGAATGPMPLEGLVRRRDKAATLWMGGAYWFNG